MAPRILVVCALLIVSAVQAAAQPAPGLKVVTAGPVNEIETLQQANEVRVVFSEPMVVLGRIPQPVRAPFFIIRPAVAGTFRWSGTTILIFTPDPKHPLPYATRYEVSIDRTASAVSGRTLASTFTFSFTTPTVKLLATEHYRRGDRFDGAAVVLLRFNQPVRGADVLAHLRAQHASHDWHVPRLGKAAEARLARLDPAGLQRFRDKVAAADAAARSEARVRLRLTENWNRKQYAPSPDLVVLETMDPPRPESWIRLTLDGTLPSPQGTATPGAEQTYTVPLDPAFFVRDVHCAAACDPAHYNPILLSTPVQAAAMRGAVQITDVTDPAQEAAVAPTDKPAQSERWRYASTAFTIEDLRFARQPPVRTYAVRLDSSLQAQDGQTLGYPWIGVVENWHESAFTSFGDGHGVWEASGGPLLPFHARNLRDVTQWAVPLPLDRLMPTILRLRGLDFHATPDGGGLPRRLSSKPDQIASHGLDISRVLSPAGLGLVWAAVQDGAPIDRSRLTYSESRKSTLGRKSSIVQVTNLGLTVKDSPDNTLIFVTRLDDGEPVAGAHVSLVRPDNQTVWRGVTNEDGIAVAPDTPLRNPRRPWGPDLAFIAVAEKDGDVAYLGSDWNEGISPWEFGVNADLHEATPLLRGTVFTDRGVYRLGEEVHFKAILRTDTSRGIRLLPAGTSVYLSLRDSQSRELDRRVEKVNEWSSAEWTFTLPAASALGTYSIRAQLDDPATPRPKPADTDEAESEFEWPGDEWRRQVHGSFLVAAYRRPDFRVDVTAGESPLMAGATLTGTVSARYLFGASMASRPVGWKVTRRRVHSATELVMDRFPSEQWAFVGSPDWRGSATEDVAKNDGSLDQNGEFGITVGTEKAQGFPYTYTIEGEVEDVSRQRIANRASQLVHPAPWYIGLRKPPYFARQETGVETALVAVDPEGQAVSGVAITVALKQVQWHSVRQAEGQGFYAWQTERREVDAGRWTVTTASDPVPLDIPLPSGGLFLVTATAADAEGRSTTTYHSFYALGEGYTAWERYDHNRIELVSERQTYKPGDTARVMIQSPWERATALVTTEREGIRTHRRFVLRSTQETVSVPITEDDIPNVYVSVLLVKGRTKAGTPSDGSDPGKPAFRLGYLELRVDDATKRLTTTVTTNQEEYRPAKEARVNVSVRDAQNRPVTGEVTLWAVDYGVLSLTAFQTPDVLRSVYVPKALQVFNTDSRQRIVSRRALVPKGADEGGGGGEDPGAGTMRRDFRVLAFWIGSTVTDAEGKASLDITLPESLTTYRIMAVSADRASRFGSGQSEIRVNKPVTLRPAFPRFMAVGDRATFGSVVTNQLREGGTATVTMRSLDPGMLRIDGTDRKTVAIAAGRSGEVTFDLEARSIGRARVQTTVRLNGETDAYEDVVPVEVLVAPETVAAYGETATIARETLAVPPGIVPAFGGLRVDMSSTAMVGLAEGARYLVEYPYGCAEQKGSRALALLLASDLGGAFNLPGIDAVDLSGRVQTTLTELRSYQCSNGGFAFWTDGCPFTSPYLTSYLLHVFNTASPVTPGASPASPVAPDFSPASPVAPDFSPAPRKYAIDPEMRTRAFEYLERELGQPPPENEGWWPAYTAWQAFAVKVLVDGGRAQDSTLNRLMGYVDRMPVFGLVHLYDALSTRNAADPRRQDLLRRIENAILPEGGSAHVEELSDPYLLWFWNSNIRSTSIALETLVRHQKPDRSRIRPMVRWLMAARREGRWGNTQENAWAMAALVRYYRAYEAEIPDFSAVVRLEDKELIREQFKGRSAEAVTREVAMPELVDKEASGGDRALTFEKQGAGTLFYSARLRYAVDRLFQEGLDRGLTIERSYAPYVEKGKPLPSATTFNAGELVRVTLRLRLTKERRYVAVTDPLPAGFEPVESWFATTARDLARAQDDQGEPEEREWRWWWERGGFDHVERHDDRVLLFATRLSEGDHVFSYIARATTAGRYRTAPAHAEEMYEPEVFGRTATAVIEVRP
jgi:alpha-2-macroglobulin